MSEQEFAARDLALCIELNEQRKRCNNAQLDIFNANLTMTRIQEDRIKLRQEYYNSKQGGQNND